MAFELPPLPFDKDALEPHMSARTLEFHHGKHHKKYVDKLNELVKGTKFAKMDLTEVIRETAGSAAHKNIFNNAAQTWNHTFFWNCLSPEGGGKPDAKFAKHIDDSFGSYDKFVTAFKEAAAFRFGSGWVWLATKGDKLEIVSMPNAGNPLTDGRTCLLTCDVWEHAYYLDYQNRREDFVGAFLEHLVNWNYVIEQWETERKAA
ncbi:MAG: superoxide dismutase [Rhodospirillaceae bacterium]|nr:superoxide dismutase [Rhodospirillaceae bacterium]